MSSLPGRPLVVSSCPAPVVEVEADASGETASFAKTPTTSGRLTSQTIVIGCGGGGCGRPAPALALLYAGESVAARDGVACRWKGSKSCCAS
jgi:hypothetical protein